MRTSRTLFEQTWFNALRTVVYAAGFLALFAWLTLTLHAFDQNFPIALPPITGPLGILLMFTGAALGLTCIATFVLRGIGTPALFDPPRKFVAIGPYRFVRNPMYIGGLAMLFGLALYLRSISILLMTIALLPVCHLIVTWHEEPSLKRKFGRPYENYLRTVSRWLPHALRTSGKASSAGFGS